MLNEAKIVSVLQFQLCHLDYGYLVEHGTSLNRLLFATWNGKWRDQECSDNSLIC